MDFAAIYEEIALEGLDGITLNALWQRLESRSGFVEGKLDDDYKCFIWKNIAAVPDFKFYTLQEPRPELVIFRYSDYVLSERCRCTLPINTPADIYSHKMIDKNGELGCCDHYDTRINVTDQVRTSDHQCLLYMNDIISRWDQHFVIVASQRHRNMALFGSAFCPSTVLVETYSVLELTGRARYDGEITVCKYARGLSSPKMKHFLSSGSVFTKVKMLSQLGYVTKQPFNMKYDTSPSINLVCLVHLVRFYRRTQANYKGHLIALTNYLLAKPDHTATYSDVIKDLNLSSYIFKKQREKFQEHFVSKYVNYTDFYPGAKDWKTKGGVEKRVKIVSLCKPYKVDDDDDDDDDDDEDETNGEDEEETETVNKMDVNDDVDEEEAGEEDMHSFKPAEKKVSKAAYGYLSYGRSVLSQIKILIDKSGEQGITERELKNRANLDRIMWRNCEKELTRTKSIVRIKRAFGTTASYVLLSPEVAERLERNYDSDIAHTEAEQETGNATEVQDFSTLSEDTDKTKLITDKNLEELNDNLKDINVSCVIDRAVNVTQPTQKKEENDKKVARKKFILTQLAQKKVYHNIHGIFVDMVAYEKKQGQKELMCRKSFKRIMKELYDEGKLFYIKVHERHKADKLIQQMVVEPNISLQDYRLQEALLSTRSHLMRLNYKQVADPSLGTKEAQIKKSPEVALEKAGSSVSLETTGSPSALKTPSKKLMGSSMVSVCQMLDKDQSSISGDTTALLDQSISSCPGEASSGTKFKRSIYRSLPKFERAKLLHKYLFYLLYGYEGRAPDVEIKEEDISETPTVYLDVDDWRRYLPPLKKHNESFLKDVNMDGVCMIGDLVLHLPLVIFCNILTILSESDYDGFISTYPYLKKIDGLQEMLDDVNKKNYPLSAVPRHILSHLVYKRKYLPKFNENLLVLCQMGLLTYQKKTNSRELEFISIHLHKKAMLLDTRKSLPGYIMTRCPEESTFEVLRYHFQSMEEVLRYWNDFNVIGLTTKLGLSSIEDVPGNNGTITLIDATKPQSCAVTSEDWLPGDHRGAAGLDSTMFAHRLANWVAGGGQGKSRSTIATPSLSTEIKNEKDDVMETTSSSEQRHSLPKIEGKSLERTRKTEGETDEPIGGRRRLLKKERRKIMGRKILPKSPRKKNVISPDDVDKQAKLNMRRLRSSFSSLENGMLLLSQVASCILSPRSTILCVNWSTIRDILRELLPESKDKTTNAIKGKMGRLLKDDKFRIHLTSYLSQAQTDKKLIAKFKSKRYRIYSKGMEKQFRELVLNLRDKFSSPWSSQTLSVPPSLKELIDQYDVRNTLDILYKPVKLSGDVTSVEDIQKMVVWEFLESLLHLTKPLSGSDVHFMLSHYPDSVIVGACTDLRTYGIMVQLKRKEKNAVQILDNNPALLNNHKCQQRHKDALKSRMPVDLFSNLKGQIDVLVRSRQRKISLTVSKDSLSDKMMNAKEFTSLDLYSFQGGSVLAVISLMPLDLLESQLNVPDEMVKLDEEGMQKLSFKPPESGRGHKRKLDEFDSEEDSAHSWTNAAKEILKFKPHRTGMKNTQKVMKEVQSTSSTSSNELSVASKVDNDEKCLKLRTMTITMRGMKSAASGVLGNFTVWVASGSLLTLARTSLIESLDLLTSRCLLQRNFIVEPLHMKFALKDRDEPEAMDTHDKEEGDVTAEGVPVKKCTTSFESNGMSRVVAEQGQEGSDNPDSGVDVLLHSLSSVVNLDLYKDLLKHMEKCFSSDMEKDDMWSVLQTVLPADLLEEGKKLFQVIDESGALGIHEADLERKIGSFMFYIKPLLHRLLRADALNLHGSHGRMSVDICHVTSREG